LIRDPIFAGRNNLISGGEFVSYLHFQILLLYVSGKNYIKTSVLSGFHEIKLKIWIQGK